MHTPGTAFEHIRSPVLRFRSLRPAHASMMALVERILVLHQERATLDPAQHLDEIWYLGQMSAEVDAEIE